MRSVSGIGMTVAGVWRLAVRGQDVQVQVQTDAFHGIRGIEGGDERPPGLCTAGADVEQHRDDGVVADNPADLDAPPGTGGREAMDDVQHGVESVNLGPTDVSRDDVR